MKLLEKVGLIGIGYILKDCGAFYPSSQRGSYYGDSKWKQPDSTNPYMTGDKVTHNGSLWTCTKKSPGEKIKNMLTEKLTTVIEKAIYGSEGTGYAVHEMTFTSRYRAECALDDMTTVFERYGVLSVRDYYECCEDYEPCERFPFKYKDTRYGWRDIQDFRVVRNLDGMYVIKTPKPELIEHDRKLNYSEYYKPMSKNEPEHEFINEITEDEFSNEHDDYLKETIAIYKDYVEDEDYGCLIEYPEKLIGEENYRRICENMPDYDWVTYYIRNDELATDFKVVVCNENYADVMSAKKPEKHEVKIESLDRDKEDFE